MGLFDRFRRKSAPPPAPAVPTQPTWQPKPPLVSAMEVSMLTTGRADDPHVSSVHEALERALAQTFGTQQPLCWTRTPLGTLAHVRVYWVDGAKGPYFHYLGWGLSEIALKHSPKADVSGFGVELSLKLRARPDERQPDTEPIRALKAPDWPAELLHRLAGGIERSGRPYGHDHWIEAAAAASFGPERVRHMACAFDEGLSPIETPNGSFRYVQLYPLDDAELAQMKAADASRTIAAVLAQRKAADPDLVFPRTA